jgi:hypothetical protein
LWRVSAGGFTQLGSTVAQTLTNNQTYVLKLEMIGTAIKVYVDGSQIISVTDSGITQVGKAGIRMFGSTSQSDTVGIHIDNYSADDVGGSVANTLTSDPGTLTLTGSTVGMSVARQLAISPASLVLTGATVDLRTGKVLGVTPASLSLAGSTVDLLLTRTIGVTPASLILTGSDVGLAVARRLSVTPGTLTLTGGTVTLTGPSGGGSTVTILSGVSTGKVGGPGVSTINKKLTDAGGGTYTVTEESSVSMDNRDSPNREDYIIG